MNQWRTVVRGAVWNVALGMALLSPGQAQEVETFLLQRISRPGNDAPAYVSAVNERVAIHGDYVYVADGTEGLAVYRLTGASEARPVGEYKTGGNAWSVRVRGDRVYVSDQSPSSPTVLDARNPMQLRVLDRSEVSSEGVMELGQSDREEEPGRPKMIAAIVENRLYIARNDFDVTVIALRMPPDWLRLPQPSVQPAGFTVFHTDATGLVSRTPTAADGVPQGTMLTKEIVTETDVMEAAAAANPTVERPIGLGNPELSIFAENGLLRLHITARAGQRIRLQRSGDLIGPWMDWARETLRDDEMDFTDSPNEGQSFYRAVAE